MTRPAAVGGLLLLRELQNVLLNPLDNERQILRIRLDSDTPPAVLFGDLRSGPAAKERIENDAASMAARQNAGLLAPRHGSVKFAHFVFLPDLGFQGIK